MILSSCTVFHFPGLDHNFPEITGKLSPWENRCEILLAYSRLHFPVEEEGSILKNRVLLSYNESPGWTG
jgi:hypothetical protein